MHDPGKMERTDTCANIRQIVRDAFFVRRYVYRFKQFKNEVGTTIAFPALEIARELRKLILGKKVDLIMKPLLRHHIIAYQDFGGSRCPSNGMNDSIDFSAPPATEERLDPPVAKHRTSGKNGIAIADATERVPPDNDLNPQDIRPEDLVKFGLIPEFTGRLPVITSLKDLSEDELVRVLTEPKNSLVKQYQKLLAMDGVELVFEQKALVELAKIALRRKTGARGLRAEMERLMTDVMYEAPGNAKMKKVVVTPKMIKEKLG